MREILSAVLSVCLAMLPQGLGGKAGMGGNAGTGGGSAGALPSLNQIGWGCGTDATNPTCTATSGSNAVSGDIVVEFQYTNNSSVVTLSAPTGCATSWTQVGSGFTGSDNSFIQIYVGTVTLSASCAVVVSGTSATSDEVSGMVVEWKNTSTTVDGGSGSGYAFAYQGICVSCTGPTVSPSVSNDAVTAFSINYNGTLTITAPFTVSYNTLTLPPGGAPGWVAYDVPAATGSLTVSWNDTGGSGNKTTGVVALKP